MCCCVRALFQYVTSHLMMCSVQTDVTSSFILTEVLLKFCTCMYLSLICSQVEMQLEMYRWMNSGGKSTAVVNLRRQEGAPVRTSDGLTAAS